MAIDRTARAVEWQQLRRGERAGPRDDDIRMEREDLLEIETMAVADACNLARGRGFV